MTNLQNLAFNWHSGVATLKMCTNRKVQVIYRAVLICFANNNDKRAPNITGNPNTCSNKFQHTFVHLESTNSTTWKKIQVKN